MNVARMLAVLDLKRDTYNSLLRRATADNGPGFKFLARPATAFPEERFDFGHCVAVGCVRWLMETIDVRNAAAVINQEFLTVRDLARRALADRDALAWLNVWQMSDGTFEAVADVRSAAAYQAGRDMQAPARPAREFRGVLFLPVHKIARDLAARAEALGETAAISAELE